MAGLEAPIETLSDNLLPAAKQLGVSVTHADGSLARISGARLIGPAYSP